MMNMLGSFNQFEREIIKERTKLGLARARANGRIGGGRYKLSRTQQEEAIKMIRLGEKSQAEIAELFNVDRSTVSRMMREVREKELLKAARWTRPLLPAIYLNFASRFIAFTFAQTVPGRITLCASFAAGFPKKCESLADSGRSFQLSNLMLL